MTHEFQIGPRRAARLGSLLIAAVLAVAACGGDNDATTDDPTASDAEAPETNDTEAAAPDDSEVQGSAETAPSPTQGDSGEFAPAGTGNLTIIPLGAADCWKPDECNVGKMYLNVYSTLLYTNPDGELTGYLAEEWESTPTQLTFTLKEGITCSDGHELTASDVKSSLDFYFAGKSTSRAGNFGAGPWTVSADDATRSVTIDLGTPYTDAIYGVVDGFPGHHTSIICPAGIEALKANPDALDTADQTYGTGPYVVESAVPGGDVTLALRPEFAWGPNGVTAQTPGMPETITYLIQGNPTTAANLVQAGEVNIATITGPDAQRLAQDDNIMSQQINATQTNGVDINQGEGRVGADMTVRQAIITAIDPEKYIQALAQPANTSSTIVIDSVECFDPSTADLQPEHDVEAARQLLLDDGWTMDGDVLTKDGQPLSIDLLLRDGFGSSAEYVASALEELGAQVGLRLVDNNTWIADRVASNYDVTILNNVLNPATLGLATPNYATPNAAGGGRNHNQIQEWEQYAALVAEAESNTGDAYCEPLGVLQRQLWENWNWAPLYGPIIQLFGNGVDISELTNPNFSIFGARLLDS